MKKSFFRSYMNKTYLKSNNTQKRNEALEYFAETKDKSALKYIIKAYCEGYINELDTLSKIDTEWMKQKQTRVLATTFLTILNSTYPDIFNYKKIQRIIEVLGIIGDESAVPIFIKIMLRKHYSFDSDKVKFIKQTALQSTEKCGIKATQQLIIALENADDDLKKCIVQIFGNLKDSSTIPVLVKFASEYVGPCQGDAIVSLSKFGTEGVSHLYGLLNKVEDYMKGGLILAIAQTKCEEANEILKKLLISPEYNLRKYAVEGIGANNYPGYEDELIRLLDDKSINEQVVESLGKLKSTKALEKIIATRTKNRNISYMVAWYLGEIGGSIAIDELKRILIGNSSIEIRTMAIKALIKLRPDDLESILISHIDDRHNFVARESIDALRKIKVPSALKILVSRLKKENIYNDNLIDKITWAIATINPDVAIKELLSIEKDFYEYRVAFDNFTNKKDKIRLFYLLLEEIFNTYLKQISREILEIIINYNSAYVLKAHQDDSIPYTKEAQSSEIFDFSTLQTAAEKELHQRVVV